MRRVCFITAGPITKLCAWGEEEWFLSFGNRTQNSRVAGVRPNHQPIGGSDPNHQGIWSPPRVFLIFGTKVD